MFDVSLASVKVINSQEASGDDFVRIELKVDDEISIIVHDGIVHKGTTSLIQYRFSCSNHFSLKALEGDDLNNNGVVDVYGVIGEKVYQCETPLSSQLSNLEGNGAIYEISYSILLTMMPLSYGLAAYFPFNGNANDESGNEHITTVIGATLIADRFNNANQAYHFNGDAYIRIIDSPLLEMGSNSYTITAWVMFDRVAQMRIYSHGAWGCSYPGYMLRTNWNLQIHQQFDCVNCYELYNYGDTMLSTGIWYFVANTVQRSSNAILYVNSVADSAVYGVSACDIARSQHGYIGGSYSTPGVEPFYGSIDEVRIYNRALTPSEVQQLYLEGLSTAAPTFLPTAVPSFQPTKSSTPLPTGYFLSIQTITQGGTYSGNSASENFVLDSALSITVTGGDGIDKFTILPHDLVTYTITDFDINKEQIDLSRCNILDISAISISDTVPVVVSFGNNQKIKLWGVSSDDLAYGNFIFASPPVPTQLPTLSPTSSPIAQEQNQFNTQNLIIGGVVGGIGLMGLGIISVIVFQRCFSPNKVHNTQPNQLATLHHETIEPLKNQKAGRPSAPPIVVVAVEEDNNQGIQLGTQINLAEIKGSNQYERLPVRAVYESRAVYEISYDNPLLNHPKITDILQQTKQLGGMKAVDMLLASNKNQDLLTNSIDASHTKTATETGSFMLNADYSSLGLLTQQILEYSSTIRYFFKLLGVDLPKVDLPNEIWAGVHFAAGMIKIGGDTASSLGQMIESGSYYARLELYDMLAEQTSDEKLANLMSFAQACGKHIAIGEVLGLTSGAPVYGAINGAAMCLSQHQMLAETDTQITMRYAVDAVAGVIAMYGLADQDALTQVIGIVNAVSMSDITARVGLRVSEMCYWSDEYAY